jgi:hypothetical protein
VPLEDARRVAASRNGLRNRETNDSSADDCDLDVLHGWL